VKTVGCRIEQCQTSARAELIAIMHSLQLVEPKQSVTVFTDSMYCCYMIRDMKFKLQAQHKPMNLDILLQIFKILVTKEITLDIKWVPGHSDDPQRRRNNEVYTFNIKADKLARQAHQSKNCIYLGEQASDNIQLYAGSVGYQNIKKYISVQYNQEYAKTEIEKATPRVAQGTFQPSTIVFNNKKISSWQQFQLFRAQTNGHILGFNPIQCKCGEISTFNHLTLQCTRTETMRLSLLDELRTIETNYKLHPQCLQLVDTNKLRQVDPSHWAITIAGTTSTPPATINKEDILDILYDVQQKVVKFIEGCIQEFNSTTRNLS